MSVQSGRRRGGLAEAAHRVEQEAVEARVAHHVAHGLEVVEATLQHQAVVAQTAKALVAARHRLERGLIVGEESGSVGHGSTWTKTWGHGHGVAVGDGGRSHTCSSERIRIGSGDGVEERLEEVGLSVALT